VDFFAHGVHTNTNIDKIQNAYQLEALGQSIPPPRAGDVMTW